MRKMKERENIVATDVRGRDNVKGVTKGFYT